MSNNTLTKMLLSCCVHGDEWLGKYISDNYPVGKNEHYMWRSMIANPEAMHLNTRFIDTDLNRAFPGKADGNYEERRAHQINRILPQYDLILDWHQAESEMDDMIFVPKLTPYLQEVC